MITNYIRKASYFFSRRIWEIDTEELSRVRRFMIKRLRLIIFVFKGFFDHDCLLRATALTYTTLLSVVPMLAVGLSLFAAFGKLTDVASRLQNSLMSILNPTRAEAITSSINTYIENIRTAEIGAVAFIFLIFTSIGLIASMEKSFNDIWGVKKGRNFVQKFIIYWCLLTLGPVLMGVSLALTGTLIASLQSADIQQYFSGIPILSTIAASSQTFFNTLLALVAPLILDWTLLTLMYIYMPNKKVRFVPALTGAVVAGTVFEIAKRMYAWHIGEMLAASPINKAYSALGAIPIFLLWIYIVWLIVLFGAEISFSAQNITTYLMEKRTRGLSQSVKEFLALRITLACSVAFRKTKPALTRDQLSLQFKIPVHLLNDILESLIRGRVLVEDSSDSQQVFPARDTSLLTIKDVIDAMRKKGSPMLNFSTDQQQKYLEEIVGKGEKASAAIYGKVNFAQLVDSLNTD